MCGHNLTGVAPRPPHTVTARLRRGAGCCGSSGASPRSAALSPPSPPPSSQAPPRPPPPHPPPHPTHPTRWRAERQLARAPDPHRDPVDVSALARAAGAAAAVCVVSSAQTGRGCVGRGAVSAHAAAQARSRRSEACFALSWGEVEGKREKGACCEHPRACPCARQGPTPSVCVCVCVCVCVINQWPTPSSSWG